MAELKRKQEDELTTADLAGRTESKAQTATTDETRGPTLVKGDKMVETSNAGNPERVSSEGSSGASTTPLFPQSDITELRVRWNDVQSGFVDEPRQAVEEADKLVAMVLQRLTDGFAHERAGLEKQWDRGDNVSTEDLRVALQRYRSFFDRLLAA